MTTIIHCKYCDTPSDEWSKEIIQKDGKDIMKLWCSCGYFLGWQTIITEKEIAEMRKRNALRQKKYMERKREDPVEYEKMLEKKRIAKAEKFINMTDEEREIYLKKAREYQKAYKERKKMLRPNLTDDESG